MSGSVPSSGSAETDWIEDEVLTAPMEICWQFEYAIRHEKLERLYRRAKRAQWDAEEALDWSHEIDPSQPLLSTQHQLTSLPVVARLSKSQRETFTAHAHAHLLSQFLHGEQGALMTASALGHAAPDYEAKLYSATQAMDEARHVEVFARYIKKLAITYPIAPMLRDLIDDTLAADHYAKVMIGMNLVVECLALAMFHNIRRETSCPLLRSLTTLVLRDESRHVGFGRLYLTTTLGDMHPDDREDVAGFAFEAVRRMVESAGGVDGGAPQPDPGFLRVLENTGIAPADFIASVRETGAFALERQLPYGHLHTLRDLVMPGLVRVGAVTPRTRAQFEKAGIPVWEDTRALEALEAADA